LNWTRICSSADGNRLLAAADQASIYLSTDSGVSWTTTLSPGKFWRCLASSADANRVFAIGSSDTYGTSGLIYTAQTVPAPVLGVDAQGSNLVLSWLVPSMNFALQENADLGTPSWTDVSTLATLNLTNLHYEMMVERPIGPRFYRLVGR
jgi:hypothetical protein